MPEDIYKIQCNRTAVVLHFSAVRPSREIMIQQPKNWNKESFTLLEY